MANENQQEMVNFRQPCFYQIFSSNSSAEPEQLKIPLRFRKQMERKRCGPVSLMGPSGNVWLVELVQQNDDMYFGHGWSAFVRDHCIECGDLLVFRFDGELCFTVQVFDQSACEKEDAFHCKCTQHPNPFTMFGTGIGDKREREEQDEKFECGSKRIRGLGFVDSSKQEAVVGLSDKERCQLDETKQCCGSPPTNSSMPLQPKSKSANEKSDLIMEAAIRKRNGKEDDLNLHDRGYVAIVSEREKQVSKTFISCFPYFVRIMKRFNISGSYTLNIPYQFSMAHLPNCKTEIVLRTVKGACWTVNSLPTTRVHTSHTLCGGWMAFVRSNEIKMGDICIFELVRKLEFRVFILRVGKDSPENQSGKLTPNRTNIGCAATSHNIESFRKKSRKNSLKLQSKLIQNAEICDKQGSNKSQATAFSHCIRKCGNTTKLETPTHSAKNAEGELGSQGVASVRTMAALTEEKTAKSFTSGFPNFVRVMRKFNISGSYTLKIPHQFSSAHLPNCKTGVVLRNIHGGCWTVNSVPDSKGRAVHTFCGGWMAFVRDNDVKIGDTCMFELVGKCEMLVHISGVGREASFDHKDGKSLPEDLPLVPFSSNCHAL